MSLRYRHGQVMGGRGCGCEVVRPRRLERYRIAFVVLEQYPTVLQRVGPRSGRDACAILAEANGTRWA